MTVRGGERGQINFDFAVGVSILIVAVILAFSLVPSVFGGVTEGRQQSDGVVADRVAANLVEGSLAVDNEPGSVDPHCLRAFFGHVTQCGFNGGSVADNLGVENRFVNVTVLGDTDGDSSGVVNEKLYWDASSDELTDSSTSEHIYGGDDTTNAQQVGTSRRAVTVNGTPVRIIVRVW